MHNASEEIYMWSAQSIIYNVITEAALVVNYSCTFDDNGKFFPNISHIHRPCNSQGILKWEMRLIRSIRVFLKSKHFLEN